MADSSGGDRASGLTRRVQITCMQIKYVRIFSTSNEWENETLNGGSGWREPAD